LPNLAGTVLYNKVYSEFGGCIARGFAMIDHFGFIAPYYDFFLGRGRPKRLARLLNISSGDLVLDAGGGTGRVSSHFSSDAGRVVVSDTSFPMLVEARKKGGLLLSLSPAEALPFKDDVFDTIVVVDALHHFEDQEASVEELARVLKPGGRLVVEEPDIALFPVKAVALAEKLLKMRSRFLSATEIGRMAERAGLKTRIEKTRAFRTWIIGDK
jgi:SAM-dependent methyltransferase